MYHTKLDTSSIPWSPTGWAGVSMKLLQKDEQTGGVTGMIRMEAGSSIPAHSHTHTDHCVFVIEGDLAEENATYGPGSFLVAKAGTPHGPHHSPSGCVLLSWYPATPDFVAVG